MKPKALAKLAAAPGAVRPRAAAAAARTLYEFDDVFTAPLHGFRDTARLLGARLGQAAPGAHPHPGAGAQRAQRPLRAGGVSLPGPRRRWAATSRCGSRRRAATWAFRTARFPGHVLRHAAGGDRLAAPRTPDGPKLARMDDIVKAALRKWPNVPHCYGWLALDARGDWYMRDDRIQAAGRSRRSRAAASRTTSCSPSSSATTRTTTRGALVLPERAAARLRGAGGRALGVARRCRAPAGRCTSHTGQPAQVRGSLARRAAAACSWTPTSASAWCTRWTPASRRRRSRPAPGRPASCRSPQHARALRLSCCGRSHEKAASQGRPRRAAGGRREPGLSFGALAAEAAAAGALGSSSLPPPWLAM